MALFDEININLYRYFTYAQSVQFFPWNWGVNIIILAPGQLIKLSDLLQFGGSVYQLRGVKTELIYFYSRSWWISLTQRA